MKKLKLFTVSATGIGRFLLSITFRLMLFNIILVFLPVVSILYLDTYERQLLDAQEKSMVQQGRLFSAALSDSGSLDAGKAAANCYTIFESCKLQGLDPLLYINCMTPILLENKDNPDFDYSQLTPKNIKKDFEIYKAKQAEKEKKLLEITVPM